MVLIRIHCDSCGGSWDVYSSLRDFDQARQCPHCEHRIDGATWREKILPAFDAARLANLGLHSDHCEYHTAPFTVDFIADTIYTNAAHDPNAPGKRWEYR